MVQHTLSPDEKIALLIDCDNISCRSIEGVLRELAGRGKVNVRLAFGDWKNPAMAGWSGKTLKNSLRPMQQFAYTPGKNATDAAMIISAMDLLHAKNVNAFALMTSDSDFTPLAMRIREDGAPVYGFGGKHTPQPFVEACSVFTYIENLIVAEDNAEEEIQSNQDTQPDAPAGENDSALKYTPVSHKKTGSELREDAKLANLLLTAVEQASGDDDWANMATVGRYISNNSSFSPVNYGYSKLSALIKATDLFDVDLRDTTLYVRDKRKGDK